MQKKELPETAKIRCKTMGIFEGFLQSAKEIKGIHTIVICGLMAALAIAINHIFPPIRITPHIHIGFSGYPNRIVDYLFGPVTGAIFGGTLDIVKYFLNGGIGGAFFWGYTLNPIVASLIYGAFLYQKPVKIWRIATAQLLVKMLVNVGLGTLWASILGGESFMLLVPARFIKNLIQWPVDTLILFELLIIMQKTVLPLLKSEKHYRK